MSATINASSISMKDSKTLLYGLIREVPNFPKPGIIYKDITPLLSSPSGLNTTLDLLQAEHAEQAIDIVVGIESRGFIFGAALAARLGAGFVPVRKPGKLPAATNKQKYALEYGHDTLEIHRDAISHGQRVLVCDDLIATGGTAHATGKLVQQLGGALIGYTFIIELAFLNGRKQLDGFATHSLIRYE